MSEVWQTGDPPRVGQFGRRLRGKESVGYWAGLEWLYSEHDASQTVMTPDYWCEVVYPEPPEPEKPQIQRVAENLGIPTWMFGVEREEGALLWYIQMALGEKGYLILHKGGMHRGINGGDIEAWRSGKSVFCSGPGLTSPFAFLDVARQIMEAESDG